MSITAVFTSVIGALSSPTALATSTVLTGANTVIGGIGLKNDADIKAGISTANSKLSDIQNQLDEIQAISESGANKTDVKALFAAIHQPPAQAVQAPPQIPQQVIPQQTPPQIPVQQTQIQQPPVQTVQQPVQQTSPQTQPEDIPEWAKAIIEQQNKIMAQNSTPGGTPAATNVTVNNQPPAEAAIVSTPQTPTASVDEKLDKLIGVVGVMVNSINQLTNQTPHPADPTTPATPAANDPEPTSPTSGK